MNLGEYGLPSHIINPEEAEALVSLRKILLQSKMTMQNSLLGHLNSQF